MKKRTRKPTSSKKLDWADEVRKYKPLMNSLSEEEREALRSEALSISSGKVKARLHASSG